MPTLLTDLTAIHEALDERLSRAESARRDPDPRRTRDDIPQRTDFLAAASRHVAAVESTLVPIVRHRLPDGAARARDLVHQCRRFEVALTQARAKLSGSAYAVRRTWSSLWSDVRRELEATCDLERECVEALAEELGDEDAEVAARLTVAEGRGPTRAHPYLPHSGPAGWVARGVARRIDAFWDATQGRVPPDPLVPRQRDES